MKLPQSNRPAGPLTILTLPTDIRKIIYRKVFQGSKITFIPQLRHDSTTPDKQGQRDAFHATILNYQILLTCQTFHQEARDVLRQETRLYGGQGPTDHVCSAYFLAKSSPDSTKRHVKHLRNIKMTNTPGERTVDVLAQFPNLQTCQIFSDSEKLIVTAFDVRKSNRQDFVRHYLHQFFNNTSDPQDYLRRYGLSPTSKITFYMRLKVTTSCKEGVSKDPTVPGVPFQKYYHPVQTCYLVFNANRAYLSRAECMAEELEALSAIFDDDPDDDNFGGGKEVEKKKEEEEEEEEEEEISDDSDDDDDDFDDYETYRWK